MPTLKANAGLDSRRLGIALAAFAVGLVFGTRLAGPILGRAGARTTIRGGVPALAATLAALPWARGAVSLTTGFAAVGAVSGVLDVAMNLETVAVEDRFERRIMSTTHAMWSVSMMGAALVASLAIGAGAGIASSFGGVAAAMTLVTYPLLRWLPPGRNRHTDEHAETARPVSLARVVALCLIGFAMFMTEGIAADWGAVYLREVDGASGAMAGLGVVAFSAGMTTSRFAGDRLRMRVAPSTWVRFTTTLGALALIVATFADAAVVTIVSLAVLGLGLGPAVPYAFGAAGRARTGPGRTALPLAVTSSYVGSIVGPVVVGFTASAVGLDLAFAVPIAMCLATAIVAPALRETEDG